MLKRFLLLLVFSLNVQTHASAANYGKLVTKGLQVLTGVGAAESLRRSANYFEDYKTEKSVLDKLREKGIDPQDNAIYSVYFKTTGGYWADFFSKPDVYFYVEIEGVGRFLVPEIRNDYDGTTPIMERILSKEVKPGTKIIVHVLDDDTTSNVIWNNLLKTKWSMGLLPGTPVTKYLKINLNASGQLLLPDQNVTIDAPDYIAHAEFRVPDTKDGIWAVNGKFYEPSGNEVGEIQFASVWSARKELGDQTAITSSKLGWFIFFAVVGVCLLIWFGNLNANNNGSNTESSK